MGTNMGTNVDYGYDFEEEFVVNRFDNHMTQTFLQVEPTMSLSNEELGLNQTNSNRKVPTSVPGSPDSAAHDSSTFSSFPFPVSLDPFPLNELFGASNNDLYQNNILDCPQLPANENAYQSTNVATSTFPGFADNMQQARPSFFSTTITTTHQHPDATVYSPQHGFNVMHVQPQQLFQPVGPSQQNANVVQAQQLFQPVAPNQQNGHILQPQQMFSPTQQQMLQPINPGYGGFNNMHLNQQNAFHGNVAQAQQMLQTQYNLNRMHQNQQNVFPGNVPQPHQMLMGQQMNQSTLNNQLFHNATNNNFQSPTSQYPNRFTQNMIGGADRQSSVYGNQQGRLFLNNNQSSSSWSQDLSGQLNHQQPQMTPNMVNPQITSSMMPASTMHSGPQQSFHQGRPVGLFQQGSHPIRPQHSVPYRSGYIPQQILMAPNANNLQSSSSNMMQSRLSVDSSHDNQNPLSIFLAEIDNSRLKHPRSPRFQLRLPNSPIFPRPEEPSHDLTNKRKHNGTQIKDQPIIPSMSSGYRAGVLADDQQLVDVPILAHDSERANSLLPGQSSRPLFRPQIIEVEAVYLEDSSPVNSHQSRVEKENSSDEETGLLSTDKSDAKLTAPKGKKTEGCKHFAEQFASRNSSEQGGIGAETRSRKKAKRAQEGSSAPSEQNGSQNSAFPLRKEIENKVYDPEYEAMGLPVDPHLRMFASLKK